MIEVTGTSDGMTSAFAFHHEAGGTYRRDSPFDAEYRCGPSERLHVLVSGERGTSESREFSCRFGPDTYEGKVTCFPAPGVELECSVCPMGDEDSDDDGGHSFPGGSIVTITAMTLR